MIVFGVGLGTSMPLFMLAVQNAVPYRVMGVSTSTIQFLRSVGGTMGVAVMFSLIQSHYHDGLSREIPQAVQAQPQLFKAHQRPAVPAEQPGLQPIRAEFPRRGERAGAVRPDDPRRQGRAGRRHLRRVLRLRFRHARGGRHRRVHEGGAVAQGALRWRRERRPAPAKRRSGPGPSTAGAVPALGPSIAGAANGSALNAGSRPAFAPLAVVGALGVALVAAFMLRGRRS